MPGHIDRRTDRAGSCTRRLDDSTSSRGTSAPEVLVVHEVHDVHPEISVKRPIVDGFIISPATA
jgi:hypothetical protein